MTYNYHSKPRRIWHQTLGVFNQIIGKKHEVNIEFFQNDLQVEN